MNYKINTGAGDNFHNVAERAKDLAVLKGLVTEFYFNGVTCIVDNDTNLDWLYRDYANSWTMKWETVGPHCPEKYTDEVQSEFERLTKIKEDKAEEENRLYKIKEEKERSEFNESIKGIEFEVVNADEYNEWKGKNTDGYGNACFEYAEGWAKRMQVEIENGKTVKECADDSQKGLGFMGITGFMYGMAVSILSKCWKHGEELRKWHNKEYNHEGDGVVNPAILTISTKE